HDHAHQHLFAVRFNPRPQPEENGRLRNVRIHTGGAIFRSNFKNASLKSRRRAAKKNLLTHSPLNINLSAFVDINELMKSGRGTGPMKPRQPVAALSAMSRCQFQLRFASGKNEKSARVSTSSHHGKGFFIAPNERRYGTECQ